jgi:uncharacterized protein YkwD
MTSSKLQRPQRIAASVVVMMFACGSTPTKSTSVPGSNVATDQWATEPTWDPTQSSTVELGNNNVPTAPVSAPATPSNDPLGGIVGLHNQERAKHCAAPLRWSPEVAAVAQRWANGLAARGCVMEHSHGNYGENLAMIGGGQLTAGQVVAMWYDEVALYNFSRPGFSMQTGHFTQVVWRGTSKIGCAKAACDGGEVWVCNYDGPGNWEGAFPSNVVPRGTNCGNLR